MLSEKEISQTDIPGNPNPVMEMNEFMNDSVLLYGHPGLCKTSKELLASDGFQLILQRYLKHMTEQDSPILSCMKSFKTAEGYDTKKIAAFLQALYEKEYNEAVLGHVDQNRFVIFLLIKGL